MALQRLLIAMHVRGKMGRSGGVSARHGSGRGHHGGCTCVRAIAEAKASSGRQQRQSDMGLHSLVHTHVSGQELDEKWHNNGHAAKGVCQVAAMQAAYAGVM
jgi:hypothetical protein